MSSSKRSRATVSYKEGGSDGEESNLEEDSNDDAYQIQGGKKREISAKKKAKKKNVEGDETDEEDDDESCLESGRIKKIYVENFMSHQKFSLNFGKNVNFITGPNGSGKSAVVAALQLCLGSRMTSTGRGNAMASMIRQGSPGPAIVKVTLVNQGPDAYKIDTYGKRITIVRTITKSSGATYKILDSNGKKVTDQKRELDGILKQFSISCENPCCVLTQELSKRFIQGNESDKYDFFLKATGLEMTRSELDKVKTDLEEVKIFLEGAESKLQPKLDRVKAAQEEVDKFKQFDKLHEKIVDCTVKRFWIHYHTNYDICDALSLEVKNREKQLQERKKEKSEAEQQLAEMEDFDSLEAQIKHLNEEAAVANAGVDKCRERYKEAHSQIPRLEQNIRAMERDIKYHANRLKLVKKEIKEMQEISRKNAAENQKAYLDKIDMCRTRIDQLNIEHEDILRKSDDKRGELENAKRSRIDMSTQVRNLESQRNKLQDDINRLSSQGSDRTALFHERMPHIVAKIKRYRSKDPICGPVGCHIKLAEGMRDFSYAAEICLRRFMSTFIVHNREDQSALQKIFNSEGAGQLAIQFLVKERRREHAKSIQGGISLHDAIVVDNDQVYNFLMDQNIDRILLSPSEEDVEKNFVVQNRETKRLALRDGIMRAIVKDGITITYIAGNKGRDYPGTKEAKLLSADMGAIVEERKRELTQVNEDLKGVRNHLGLVEGQINSANQEMKNIQHSLSSIIEAVRKETRKKNDLDVNLKEIQESESMDTSALEQEERELHEAIEQFKSQMNTRMDDLEKMKSNAQSVKTEQNEAQRAADVVKRKLDDINDRLDKFITAKSEINKKIEKADSKVKAAEKNVLDAQSVLDENLDKLSDYKIKAQEQTAALLKDAWDGEDVQVSNRDTDETLQKQIEQYNKKLEEGKKAVGLGIRNREQAIDNLKNAQNDFEKANKNVEDLNNRKSTLRRDWKDRAERWKHNLKRSSKKVAERFDRYLQKKGQSGSVEFNHNEGTLKLICQTDNFDATSLTEDVKQLSGGERSFTTLCLLLALGHVIDTPFRILDEYDGVYSRFCSYVLQFSHF